VSVLVADDDRITARVLEKQLRARGHEVQVVYAGAEAWDVLCSDSPPLVAVLDWTMPGVSGLELCRGVRAREGAPFVYLILLTGRDQTTDVMEGMTAGADEYVKKPFALEDLCQRVGHGLDLARTQRAQQSRPRGNPQSG
jgi:DNA-binding response OmpR family regulator